MGKLSLVRGGASHPPRTAIGKITGIRLCIFAMSSFDGQVAMAHVARRVPAASQASAISELEKLSRRIDDLDRKLIILRGRNPVTAVCVVPTTHGKRGTHRSAMSGRSITPT